MTTKITVSVNGNYKMPVKQGEVTVWVSGRCPNGDRTHGPVSQEFYPTHGGGETFVIGPEEPDAGDAA